MGFYASVWYRNFSPAFIGMWLIDAAQDGARRLDFELPLAYIKAYSDHTADSFTADAEAFRAESCRRENPSQFSRVQQNADSHFFSDFLDAHRTIEEDRGIKALDLIALRLSTINEEQCIETEFLWMKSIGSSLTFVLSL
jgi:hypothetical protein